MQFIINYFRNSIQEFNNITWPTRKQAVRISVIVIVFMAVTAALMGGIDQLFALGYQKLMLLTR